MHPVALLALVGQRFGSGLLRKRLALALVLASMVVVGGCGGCGLAATTSGGGTTDTATATATTAAATASTTTATATTHTTGPTPTRTLPPPTATPLPALKGKLVTQGLGSIGPNTNSSIVDVSCPAGYLVAGGGVSSGYTTFNLMWNAPISTTTWRSELYNTSPTDTIVAQVQVMCLAVSGLVGQVVTRGMGTINSGSNSTIVDVSCPSGYLVAGGGINAGYGTLVSMWNAPISTTTWREEVYNTGGTAAAQVQVECLRVSGLVGKVLTTDLGNVSSGANSPIINTACPSGYLIAGGGLKSGTTTQTLMQSLPISVTTWRSEVFNTGSATIAAQAQVDCLKR